MQMKEDKTIKDTDASESWVLHFSYLESNR